MPDEKVSLTNPGPQPGEPNFVPPAAAVPLPSLGKVYSQGSSLAGKEVLEIKAMTAKEEDILTSRGLLRTGRALDSLLRSCILDRDVDVDQMIVGDRNAALVAIRITGYGQEYKVEIECPACGEKCKHEFDLARLPVKRLGAEPRVPNSNEFVFRLSVSKAEVVFKLLTGADERELSLILERIKKISGGLESAVTTRLTQQIISIGGETDRTKLAGMIRNLPARDSRDLRTYVDKISPGVDMNQAFKCDSCGEESEVDVPMGTEFFWPSA
jgi:predicted RNA-binding Zn-ribbon protein involved in translation (DUF1610 family)